MLAWLRRRLRIGIGGLMVAVLAFGLWLGDRVKRAKSHRLALEAVKVELPSEFRQTKDGLFCLVHYTNRAKAKGKTAAVKAMLLGMSTDDGKNWTFLQAANGEGFVRRLLPEIPADLKFPKIDQKEVIEDQH